ncbi:GcvT family protein [Pseudonocardia sp. C8]|uniref:FAD-dependent oxidoreductase n=1 Tax=Pseudonocardia sp. C8 TaxID=2762759 RepID=UPI0016432052|nr:FAD-dependent oxidoreductase [Pseudonocardia sp. C8]MBC3192686.1 GcvT family protein [Pseudonocardia sp. C8]
MATTTPRIVIIGAGVVGCALADELTRRGHGCVTVLEKGPLFRTGGSTADGLLFQASDSRTMNRLASATARTYAALTENGVPCLRRVGGLEIATTPERLTDLHRRHGRAAAAGIESRILGPAECAGLHPLLDREGIAGGLHVPGDGTVEPVTAAGRQARAAVERGAQFLDHRTVTAIEQQGGRVTGVRCGDDRFPADLVICCAGLWGPVVGDLAGVAVPLLPMTHRYARTGPLGVLELLHALEAASGAAEPSLPILRHPEAGLHVRAHGHRLGIGTHAHRAGPADPRDLDAPDPGSAPPAAHPFSPDDIAPSWAAAAALLPVLRNATIADGVNGLVAGTPDGLPLLGEHPDLAGFWTAEAVGIAHSAGVAEALAEWITTGRPAVGGEPIDLAAAHVDRFDPPAPAAARARDGDVVHRSGRVSPFHTRQAELRAMVTEVGGVERPLWFEANASLPEVCEIGRREGRAARDWSPVAGAEALVARRAAGMFDLSPTRRVEVAGPHAAEFLQRLVTGDVDRPVGDVVPTLMLDADGGVRTDLTVTRLGAERFLVAVADRLDVARMRRYGRAGVELTDVTATTACLGLRGPQVREILTGLVPADLLDLAPWRAAEFHVGGVPVTGLRVAAAGEPGWELVCAAADAERLWDTVHAAGARHGLVAAGLLALESLRMEEGHLAAGVDITPEHGPDATGLGHAVDMGKGPFVGRAAVHTARRTGVPAETLATLVLDHPGAVLSGQEPVYDLPEARRFGRDPVPVEDLEPGPPGVIGRVTRAATGYTTGTSIAHAWLPTARALPGTRVAVELAGRRLTAQVVAGALRPAPTPATG